MSRSSRATSRGVRCAGRAQQRGGWDPATQDILFMTIDKARFRVPVKPGDRLDLDVVPLRTGRHWRLRGEARVGDTVVASAEFSAVIVDRSD